MAEGISGQGANVINFVLTAQNRTQPAIMGAATGMKQLNMVGYSTGSQLTNTLNSVQGAAIAMGGAAAIGLGAAINQAANFEQQMQQVQAVSNATAGEMAFLGQQAKDMAVKYGTDMTMLNEGLVTLGRAGLKDSAQQASTLEEGLKLAKMEGLELNESLEMLITTTGLLSNDKIGTDGFTESLKELNNQLITTAQTAPIKVKDIIQTLKYVGGTAEVAGLGEGVGREDLFGVIGLLGSRGVKGDVAGTALRSFLTRPASQTKATQDMLGNIGLTAEDLWKEGGNEAKPITDQIQLINDQMDAYDLNNMQRIEFWSKMVGPKMANQIMKIDPEAVEPFTQQVAEGIDLDERIDMIMDSAMEKWNQLKEAFKVGLIGIGNNLLGIIKPILDGLTGIFKALGDNPIFGLIATIGLLIPVLLAVGVGFNLLKSGFDYAMAGFSEMKGGFTGILESLGFVKPATESLSATEQQLAMNTGAATSATNAAAAAHNQAAAAKSANAAATEALISAESGVTALTAAGSVGGLPYAGEQIAAKKHRQGLGPMGTGVSFIPEVGNNAILEGNITENLALQSQIKTDLILKEGELNSLTASRINLNTAIAATEEEMQAYKAMGMTFDEQKMVLLKEELASNLEQAGVLESEIPILAEQLALLKAQGSAMDKNLATALQTEAAYASALPGTGLSAFAASAAEIAAQKKLLTPPKGVTLPGGGSPIIPPVSNKKGITDPGPGFWGRIGDTWQKKFVEKSFLSSSGKIGTAASKGSGAMSKLASGIMGLASPAGIATVALIGLAAVMMAWQASHDAWEKKLESSKKTLEESVETYNREKESLANAKESLETLKNTRNADSDNIKKHENAVKRHSEAMANAAIAAQQATKKYSDTKSDPFWGEYSEMNRVYQKAGWNKEDIENLNSGTYMQQLFHQKKQSDISAQDERGLDALSFEGLDSNNRMRKTLLDLDRWFERNQDAINTINSRWDDFSEAYNIQTNALDEIMAKKDIDNYSDAKKMLRDNIDNIGSIGKAKLATDEFGDAGDELIDTLNELSATTGETVEDILNQLDYLQTEQVVAAADSKMDKLASTMEKEIEGFKTAAKEGDMSVLTGLMGDSNEQQRAMIEILALQYAQQIWDTVWWTTFWNNAWLTLLTIIGMAVDFLVRPVVAAAQFILDLIDNTSWFAEMVANGFNAVVSALGSFLTNLGNAIGQIPFAEGVGAKISNLGSSVGGYKINAAQVKSSAHSLLDGIASFSGVDWAKSTFGGEAMASNAALKNAGLSTTRDGDFKRLVGKFMGTADSNTRGGSGDGTGDDSGNGGGGGGGSPSGGSGKDKKSDLDKLKKITVDYVFCKNKKLPDINVNLHDRAPLVDVNQHKLNIGKMEVVTKKDNPDQYMNAITNELIKKSDIISPTIVSARSNASADTNQTQPSTG